MSGNNPKQPSPEVLIKLARYHIDTELGEIYGLNSKREIGSKFSNGYYYVWLQINGHTKIVKRANVVFWSYCGRWPISILDHKDRDKTNDRIDNLEESNSRKNNVNRRLSDNRSLPLGVHLHGPGTSRTKPYQAVAYGRYIGVFTTPEEAHLAYLAKVQEIESHGD